MKGTDVSEFKAQYKTALRMGFPDKVSIKFGDRIKEYRKVSFPVRYGTNPNQPCGIYYPANEKNISIGKIKLLKEGKDGLSLTNFEDMNRALNILKYFKKPACAVMKHLNPCGFKVETKGESLAEIYRLA